MREILTSILLTISLFCEGSSFVTSVSDTIHQTNQNRKIPFGYSTSLFSHNNVIIDSTASGPFSISSEQQELPQRIRINAHPDFTDNNTNALITTANLPSKVWKTLVPVPFEFSLNKESKPTSLDVTAIFKDPYSGAKDLLCKCGLSPFVTSQEQYQHRKLSVDDYEAALEHLQQCFCLFQNYILETSDENTNGEDAKAFTSTGVEHKNKFPTFKARVVSSRGVSGQKCPRWHIDHVPLRLIVALEGPGVCYLQRQNKSNIHEWKAEDLDIVNNCEEINTQQANELIRDSYPNHREVQTKPGDAILLMGKAWEMKTNDMILIEAAVHKSPNVLPFQGRVLLTVDVVMDDFE